MVKNKEQWKAWLYLLPALVLIAIFTVWPMINTLRMAFLNGYNSMGAVGGEVFTFGIENFKQVLNYNKFWDCFKTTFWLTLVTVPVSSLLALLIAVCLNSIKPLRKILQTIYFLPYVTNSIAIGMVFAMMFNRVGTVDYTVTAGIINNILGWFGVNEINWINLGSTWFHNMVVLVIYIVWNALPFKILILLGGLQGISKQYYDAAKLDSASKWTVFWRITVPLLSPMIAYVIITGFIGGFKEYSSVIGIFGENRGPVGASKQVNTIVGFIYDALSNSNYGRASAAALLLFVVIFIITMLNLYISKKSVHY